MGLFIRFASANQPVFSVCTVDLLAFIAVPIHKRGYLPVMFLELMVLEFLRSVSFKLFW